MAPQAVFFQACPVCGRSLRMPVHCFGRQVTCVHCGGEFQATDQDHTVPVRSHVDPTGATAPLPLSRHLLADLPLAGASLRPAH